MKAILVIDDMPNCCTACPFFEFINDYEDDCRTRCNVKFGRINEYGTDVRPKWCPLKPTPERKEVSDDAYVSDYLDFDLGWNACIDAIIGDTDGTKGEITGETE